MTGLSSYIIWGFVPIFLKQLKSFDDYEIIFYRILLAALTMAVVMSFDFKQTVQEVSAVWKSSKRDFFLMLTLTLIGGGLLATNWVTYVYVVNHVSINAASFAYLILPIATTFLAFFILGEKLNSNKWLAVLLSGISCYLMANIDLKQILYISAITLSYSFYLITQRHNTRINRKISVFIQMILGTLLMLFIDPIKTAPAELTGAFWLYVSIIAVVFTVTPLLLNLHALNGMESSQLAFLIYVNPIIAFITGILIYHEKLTFLAAMSYLLLGVAIVIFNWEYIVKAAEKSGLTKKLKSETALD